MNDQPTSADAAKLREHFDSAMSARDQITWEGDLSEYPTYPNQVLGLMHYITTSPWCRPRYKPTEAKEIRERIQIANLDEVRSVLTAVSRSERFCTGAWENALETGLLDQVVDRAEELTNAKSLTFHKEKHTMIKTKSTEDNISNRDGLRIFVTRYWPRGHSRDECDEWIPSLAPSEALLKQIQKDEITWRVFERKYKKEIMKGTSDESALNPRMKNSGQKYFVRMLKRIAEDRTVTLLCTCPPDAEFCHRYILQKLIDA